MESSLQNQILKISLFGLFAQPPIHSVIYLTNLSNPFRYVEENRSALSAPVKEVLAKDTGAIFGKFADSAAKSNEAFIQARA